MKNFVLVLERPSMKTGLIDLFCPFIKSEKQKISGVEFNGIVTILKNGKIVEEIKPDSEIYEMFKIKIGMGADRWQISYMLLVFKNRYSMFKDGVLIHRIKLGLTTKDKKILNRCRDECLVT